MNDKTSLNIRIDIETHDKLNNILPHGVKTQVFRQLAEALIKTVEADGSQIIGNILTGNVRIVPVLQNLKNAITTLEGEQ